MLWLNRLPNKHETCGFFCHVFLLDRSPGSIRRPLLFFGGVGDQPDSSLFSLVVL